MLWRIDPNNPASKRVDSRTQQQQQQQQRRRLQRRSPQQMQCLRQLLPHELLFLRQFHVIRKCRFKEQQQEGYFQANQQQKEERIYNQQVPNIHRNDVARSVANNLRRGSSPDREIESSRASQVTSEDCTKSIPELV
mmetsp:Transcript_30570/g.61335  ORF Transcript_30570/g.61335 Transcript_30570/m.61335 type:complete len:137 (+) Transcript_30570:1377-1787(+)